MLRTSWQGITGVGGVVLLILGICVGANKPSNTALERARHEATRSIPANPNPPPPGRRDLTVATAPAKAPQVADASRDAVLRDLLGDPAALADGASYYQMFCSSCHAAQDLGGDSPSNLFDTVWYHGSEPSQIEATILDGYLDKGMPPWRGMLPDDKIAALTAYLVSVQPSAS